MKHQHSIFGLILPLSLLALISCKKESDHSYPTVSDPEVPIIINFPCDNRPVIKARLTPFGKLSQGRSNLKSATAGSKILFAGGWILNSHTSRVDIYDTLTKNWSTAELSLDNRDGMAVASIENKIFFAGGGDFEWMDITSRVDIYDASSDKWSIAELSVPRSNLIGATVADKVLFAGGANWENPYYYGTPVVDIYNNSSNTWSTARLSMYRYELAATTFGDKVYFAGGSKTIVGISDRIDIYDAGNNTWSESNLMEARTGLSSFSTTDQIFWAGGALSAYKHGYQLSDHIEIRNMNSGITTFACMVPRRGIDIVRKGDIIVFFTGALESSPESGVQFEIYNKATNTWYTGKLEKKICDATIISVNNRIYVAGGRDSQNGKYFDEVWELEF